MAIAHPQQPEPYLALSYCWGGDQAHKTTKARIHSQEWNLDWTNLPATIQDAIVVTIRLGYRFLWVDSLCIVQDDEVEKAHQIALMPRLFKNATITIIAGRSPSAARGFLYRRPAPTSHTRLAVKLPFRCRDKTILKSNPKMGSLYAVVWPKNDLPIDGPGSPTMDRISWDGHTEPVDGRAWCLQERYLSSRILDFGTMNTVWSCYTNSTHNNDSNKASLELTDGWNRYGSASEISERSIQRLELESARYLEIMPLWGCDWVEYTFYGLVAIYTTRALTMPQDRLIAISGIANAMLAIYGGVNEYYAGLWRRSLQKSLLWRVNPGCQTKPPPRYQAPSWSWAAVNGGVNFQALYRNIELEDLQLNISVELEEPSVPCGAVREGRLQGRGRIRRGLCIPHLAEIHSKACVPRAMGCYHNLYRSRQENLGSGEHRCRTIEEFQLLWMCPDTAQVDNRKTETCDGACDLSAEPVSLLLLGKLLKSNLQENLGPMGLVLREVGQDAVQGRGGRFSRVGMFQTFRNDGSKHMNGYGEFEQDVWALFDNCEPEEFIIF